MAKPILNGPCVVPGIGKGITARMAEHVEMHMTVREAGLHGDALQLSVNGVRREWAATFSLEHERAIGLPL